MDQKEMLDMIWLNPGIRQAELRKIDCKTHLKATSLRYKGLIRREACKQGWRLFAV